MKLVRDEMVSRREFWFMESFPTLVPVDRGVFLSRYRFLMKKFYKNAKASFYISSGMDTAESSTVIR